jgi:hypothetical protein
MKKYYYNSPRGFGNEFSIISVDQNNPKEVKRFVEFEKAYNDSQNINWKMYRISAKQARCIVATEKATAKSYLRAGLNLTENPVGATEIITATEYFEEV